MTDHIYHITWKYEDGVWSWGFQDASIFIAPPDYANNPRPGEWALVFTDKKTTNKVAPLKNPTNGNAPKTIEDAINLASLSLLAHGLRDLLWGGGGQKINFVTDKVKAD